MRKDQQQGAGEGLASNAPKLVSRLLFNISFIIYETLIAAPGLVLLIAVEFENNCILFI